MTIVAIAGQTYRLRIELESQASAGTFQASPTMAAGDVKLLILPATPTGSETYANATNAPTLLDGPTAEVIIAAAETLAAGDGGEIIAVWADAAGDEWYSVAAHIQVKAAEVATQTNITAGTITTVTTLSGHTPQTGDSYARLGAPAGASVSADIAAIAAASAAGSGAISFPVTVNDEGGDPIDGVEVWVTTDSAGTNVVAGTLSTDAMGLVTFMLDAGTYYVWRQKSGYNFTNPVSVTVS